MNPFKPRATMELVVASGTLRVIVRPSPHWLSLLLQAALVAAFAFLSFRAGARMSRIERFLSAVVIIGAIAGWFEQLFGFSEVIEFDSRQLRVRKETFGW